MAIDLQNPSTLRMSEMFLTPGHQTTGLWFPVDWQLHPCPGWSERIPDPLPHPTEDLQQSGHPLSQRSRLETTGPETEAWQVHEGSLSNGRSYYLQDQEWILFNKIWGPRADYLGAVLYSHIKHRLPQEIARQWFNYCPVELPPGNGT